MCSKIGRNDHGYARTSLWCKTEKNMTSRYGQTDTLGSESLLTSDEQSLDCMRVLTSHKVGSEKVRKEIIKKLGVAQ
jgi:hypothetical protein